MRFGSVADGPRVLHARVPRWGSSCFHGRDHLEQRQDAVVRDAAEWPRVPAWACDDIPHDRRRNERGRDGDDGQRKLAADSRVMEGVHAFALCEWPVWVIIVEFFSNLCEIEVLGLYL